ncbi:TolC family protein [Euryhalocaulis caribicus]|uniref:TolC family protein n=1 Tax=Euryhalocaulis caribicus TaxID=1161401 RepID=UPI0003A507A5|nr:TolC family protein [Euryhalocaulis caribicus]
MPFRFHFLRLKKPILNRVFGGAALSAALLVSTAAGAQQVLTEAEALELALSRPAVEDYLGGRMQEAKGGVIAAGRWANPVLEAYREGADGFGGDGAETAVMVEQEVDFSGERRLRKEAARRRLDAVRFGGRAYQMQLAADVRSAFYEVLAAQRHEAAVQDLIDQASRVESMVVRREEAGDVSLYERRRIEQETASAPAAAAEWRARAISARQKLKALVGGVDFDRVEGDLSPQAEADYVVRLEALRDRARLQALEAEAEASQAEERAAQRAVIPDVTVGLGARRIEDSLGDETGVLMSFSLPLPLFDRNEGEIAQAAGRASAARAEYRLEMDRLMAEADGAAQRLNNLISIAQTYEQDAVLPARELRRMAILGYEGGEISMLELTDALRRAFEAEQRLIELQYEARQARTDFEKLTGDIQ